MNARNARDLRRLAKLLGWNKAQLRRAKRQLDATPRDRRGAALAELRTGLAGMHSGVRNLVAGGMPSDEIRQTIEELL